MDLVIFCICFGLGILMVSATLIAGILIKLKPPKYKSKYYGFRTKITEKSLESWEYAHKICSNTLIVYSVFSIIAYSILLLVKPIFLTNALIFIFGLVFAIVGVIITTMVTQIATMKLNKKINKRNHEEDSKEN